VAVDDVAEAAVAALTKGTSGSRYIVVNDDGNMSFRQLYELQATTMGYRQTVIELPNRLLGATGWIGDILRACKIKTELSHNNVSLLMMHEHYTCASGKQALVFKSTPIAKAINDLHHWNEKNRK
jgi:nucleoside-diphosphate-sugar epimerase